jgi:hypothetical protein
MQVCIASSFNRGRGLGMSRYYFHSVSEDGVFKDDVGIEVEERDLKREATKAIFELANEFHADGEESTILGFRVVDDVGRTVLELPLHAPKSVLH